MARTLRGTVVSDAMDKSIVVAVGRVKTHPIYRKKYSQTAKFVAHDADNSYKVGDLVEIAESRPLSRTKHWVATRKLTVKELEEKS